METSGRQTIWHTQHSCTQIHTEKTFESYYVSGIVLAFECKVPGLSDENLENIPKPGQKIRYLHWSLSINLSLCPPKGVGTGNRGSSIVFKTVKCDQY